MDELPLFNRDSKRLPRPTTLAPQLLLYCSCFEGFHELPAHPLGGKLGVRTPPQPPHVRLHSASLRYSNSHFTS